MSRVFRIQNLKIKTPIGFWLSSDKKERVSCGWGLWLVPVNAGQSVRKQFPGS